MTPRIENYDASALTTPIPHNPKAYLRMILN